jgi:ribosomal protein S18 acetylase RimI-like enzyme
VSTTADIPLVPNSLVFATDIDVLPVDRTVEQRDGYLVIRSPGNPGHYWGNLLLFDDPPGAGDGARWEQIFATEFEADPQVQHYTFAWDRTDGAPGNADAEFVARGYYIEQSVGLLATPDAIHAHPRENREVRVRPLDPDNAADGALWEQVVEIWVAGRDERFSEDEYRSFAVNRLRDLRTLSRAGRGAWYVALSPSGNEIVACLGIVVTGGRGRFQAVDTVQAHRRRGICSRLVVEAAHHAAAHFGARRFVIVADPEYHAIALYESLGFERRERACGVFRPPR